MRNRSQHIDEELIASYLSGDAAALTSLVKRWHLEFCKRAYWLVKDADISKDIAQDCWQLIISKLHTLEHPAKFQSWAFRIVHNKSMDVLRKERRKRQKEETIKLDIEEDIRIDDNTEIKLRLLNAVKQLPEHQQMVLKLFYTEDYSIKEISETLNVSIGTTKSRLFHAREKLKRILTELKKHK